ncbi:MAG: metal ABC transporter permease [Candidatus Njordarchaeales archaeon]
MPDLVTIIMSGFFIRALIASFLISILSGLVGSITVFRGQTFLTAGVAHSAMAGAALGIFLNLYGYIAGVDPLFIATVFSVIIAIFVGYIAEKGETEKLEIAIGVAFGFSMSLAILFISMIREYAIRAWGLIMGDILLLTYQDLLLLVIISAVIILINVITLRELVFISFDFEGATAFGVNTKFYHYLSLISTAIAIVVVMKGVGAILVYVMLVTPAATANELANTASNVVVLAFLIALASSILGLMLSIFLNLSPSALMGIIVTTIYLVSVLRRKLIS